MNAHTPEAVDAALKETCLSTRSVFDGRLLHVKECTVRLPDGQCATREMIVHPGASAMVVLDADNNVVLERQWRAPMNRAFWEIPAGKLDASEAPFAAAQRELQEETGLTAQSWVHLGTIHNAIGYSNERIELFLAQEVSAQGAQQLDQHEFLVLHRVPLAEAIEMTHDGRITDVKTIIGLQWTQAYLQGQLRQAKQLA